MSNLAVTQRGPFPDAHAFERGVLGCEKAEIPSLARVCKLWNTVVREHPEYWIQLSEKEGIPLVAGSLTNGRENLKKLYPITLSGKIIGQFLARGVGEVPPIHPDYFNALPTPDRNEPHPQRLMEHTFVFVVEYREMERKVNGGTRLDLDPSGNLIEISREQAKLDTGRILRFPFTLSNLRMLCKYPLRGHKNKLVFDTSSWEEVFRQCNTRIPRNRVSFMRRHIAEESRRKAYDAQVDLMRDNGHNVTHLETRALSHAVGILKTGTCPDGRDPLTYARFPETVRIGENEYHVILGGFAPGVGVDVGGSSFGFVHIGVVPGGPAEVPKALELDRLAIDEGH